ncbi:MAG TPA: hypothetical protein VII24_08585 [Pseudolabrys sp.]|jgi:hypothetical protein
MKSVNSAIFSNVALDAAAIKTAAFVVFTTALSEIDADVLRGSGRRRRCDQPGYFRPPPLKDGHGSRNGPSRFS